MGEVCLGYEILVRFCFFEGGGVDILRGGVVNVFVR